MEAQNHKEVQTRNPDKKIIYITHAQVFRNKRNLSDDPKVDFNSKEDAEECIKCLVDTFGVPSMILTSPYNVCRTTAHWIEIFVKKNYGFEPKTNCLDILSNYNKNFYQLDKSTEVYNPPKGENYSSALERLKKIVDLHFEDENVFVITHSFMTNNILKVATEQPIENKKPFEGVVKIFTNDEIEFLSYKFNPK